MQRFDLPDTVDATTGQPVKAWADLRDPKDVTERQRRPVTRLNMRVAGGAVGKLLALKGKLPEAEFEEEARKVLATDDYGLLDDVADALIVALVDSWSYDKPVTVDGVLDLPSPAYEALKAETAKHVAELLPNFAPSKEGVADPASPTGSSAD